jgi:hypothetical protein
MFTIPCRYPSFKILIPRSRIHSWEKLTLWTALGSFLASAHPASAQIKVTPALIDFGERGHDERPTETLTLENKGKEPVTVSEIKPTCGCISVDPPILLNPIPPGGSEKLKVSMGSGIAMGVLEKHIAIYTEDRNTPVAMASVKMRVFENFSMEPRELHFDGVAGGEPVTKMIEIKWGARGAPRQFDLAVKAMKDRRGQKSELSDHFQSKVAEIPGGKRIEVTLKPTHPEGLIWANLEAQLDGKALVVPVTGNMFRWIKVVPVYFNFSRVSQDDPSSFVKESTLTSTDGKPFKILSATTQFQQKPKGDVRLEVDEKGGEIGKEGLEHVLRARISVGSKEPPERSFSGKVIVKTDRPEKPEITFNFFGFFPAAKK